VLKVSLDVTHQSKSEQKNSPCKDWLSSELHIGIRFVPHINHRWSSGTLCCGSGLNHPDVFEAKCFFEMPGKFNHYTKWNIPEKNFPGFFKQWRRTNFVLDKFQWILFVVIISIQYFLRAN